MTKFLLTVVMVLSATAYSHATAEDGPAMQGTGSPAPGATSSTGLAPSSFAPTPVLRFAQRQYVLETTESHVGVLMVLLALPQAHVITYHVRTPGYSASLILNPKTGVLQKAVKMHHDKVVLLVQGVAAGETPRSPTNNTDIVNVDETLIIVNIADENDSPPVLDCDRYGGSCSDLVVGYSAEDSAIFPQPLLRLTATDGDTGLFGVDGIKFAVNSTALSMDSSGVLYLLDPTVGQVRLEIAAEDNHGQSPSLKATALLTVVPVRSSQQFVVRSTRPLVGMQDVTSLLKDIQTAGGYRAVLSMDYQALNYDRKVADWRRILTEAGGQLDIYAIRRGDDGDYSPADQQDFSQSLKKLPQADDVHYIETKEDQMTTDSDDQATVTGLIVGLVVALCLLVAAIVIFTVLLKRRTTSKTYATNS